MYTFLQILTKPEHSNILRILQQSRYIFSFISYLTMNQIIKSKTGGNILKLVAIATLGFITIVGLNTLLVFGQQTAYGVEFAQYGTVGQEDQLFAKDSNGLYYVNTGTAYGIGNGMFEQVNEINKHFTIDGAIKTFGIYEDTQAFIYEPVLSNGKYSNVLFMYEIVGFNHFQLTHIYEDESGIDEEVTQLENNI